MSHRALRDPIRRHLLPNPNSDYNNYGDKSNPGLLLTRYLIEQQDRETLPPNHPYVGKEHLLKYVSSANVPPGYTAAYERWKSVFTGRDDTRLDSFDVQGRLAVGIGETSVLETSLALRQPWGVPYIPGAALKGLAASYLRNVAAGDNPELKPPMPVTDALGKVTLPPNAYSVLFGSTEDAGYIIWHDAWFNAANGSKPFRQDVITTHHPGYYQDTTTESYPTDFDDPTPIPFLSVGGRFLITLQGPPLWIDLAFDVLRRALHDAGVGAKTNAGYGRMIYAATEYRYVPPRGADDDARDLIQAIERTDSASAGRLAPDWVSAWKALPEGDLQQLLAKAIFEKVETHPRTLNRKFLKSGEYGYVVYQYLVRMGEVPVR